MPHTANASTPSAANAKPMAAVGMAGMVGMNRSSIGDPATRPAITPAAARPTSTVSAPRWVAAGFIGRLRAAASGRDEVGWTWCSTRSGTRRLLLRGGGGAPASARRRAGEHDVLDCSVRALSGDRGATESAPPSAMGDNVTRDPLPAASPVRRPHGRLAPRQGLSRGAQRHHPRVVHAPGRPIAARVPRPARRHAHARRLPRPGDGVGDHAPAGAPPQGGRGHLLQRHRGAAEARRRRGRASSPAAARSSAAGMRMPRASPS